MAITYAIDGGADATKFNIDATTGKLTFKTAPDFENPSDADADNVYEVSVKATDAGGAASSKLVKVTVTDVSENAPPQITSAGAISVPENSTNVMTITATDPDDGGITPPPGGGGEYDIPLRWDDPMFTGMTDGSGAQMKTNQTISRRSVTGADSGLFIFNQVGQATLSYCRMTSTVSNDCDVLSQVSDNTVNVDHCYINNNLPTNPTNTHADGVQLQLATWDATMGKRDTPAGAVVNLKNSMIVIGGSSVTAGFFCADQWHGRINISDVVIQTWAQHGLRLHSDSRGDIDLYCNNVYFDTRGGINGMLLNYGGKVINIRQWNNVRKCTVDNNGVLTLGAAIPQPVPSTSGTNF
jgi:hypothetical protein